MKERTNLGIRMNAVSGLLRRLKFLVRNSIFCPRVRTVETAEPFKFSPAELVVYGRQLARFAYQERLGIFLANGGVSVAGGNWPVSFIHPFRSSSEA